MKDHLQLRSNYEPSLMPIITVGIFGYFLYFYPNYDSNLLNHLPSIHTPLFATDSSITIMDIKMYQYKDGKQGKITMNVESKYLIDTKHNEKLVKLSKIKEIHLGSASAGLQKVKRKHNVCFSIIKEKMSGQESEETLDFETKEAPDRTHIILKILDQMQALGLNEERLSEIMDNVIQNENQNEIFKIKLYPDVADAEHVVLEMETVWSLFRHIDDKRVGMEVIVGSEVITDRNRQHMEVNLVQIHEIHLWNGSSGFQAVDRPHNLCFSIMHYNGSDWETLGFEMNTTEDRTAMIMDIIDKLQSHGLYPAQGLSRQIVLDTMGLDESLQVLFEPIEDLKAQNEELKEHLDQRNDEIKKLQDQQVVMRKTIHELEQKLTVEMERNKALQKELSDVREHKESDSNESVSMAMRESGDDLMYKNQSEMLKITFSVCSKCP